MLATSALVLAIASAMPQQAVERPLPPRAVQPPGVIAVTGATLYPVTGPPIDNGVMLMEGGKITYVGRDMRIPASATVLDFTGMTVMPGIVESHSHMGLKQLFRPETGSDNNELSKPINAEVRAVDGLASHDPAFRVALAAGVTTMNITTGSRSFASGQAVLVKMRGNSIDEMYLAPAGLKFAMRIASRNQWGTEVPEILEMLRERLREAHSYMQAKAAHERDERASAPAWDPQLEALAKALSGEWPVGVHAHAADAMRAAIALKDEFGLNLYIHHAEGTTELAQELAAKQIPISFGPVLPGASRDDPELLGPVRLNALGGSVSFHQDHPDGPQYYLRHTAALFVRAGMPEADALRALTLEPARIFGLQDRIGSLEPGKDADFIVLDGPPLDWESRVQNVFIEGVQVFDLDDTAAVVTTTVVAASETTSTPIPTPQANADFAIVGGEVRPVSSPPIRDGVLLVEDGRIVALGPRTEVIIPGGAEVIDATGLVVTPGFIDARTSVWRSNATDRQSLIRDPAVRMADDLRLGPLGEQADASVHDWVRDGVTSVYVAPGTDNLVAGFGAVVKLAGDRQHAVLDSAAALHIVLGDEPRRRFDVPTTRQGMVALLRQWFTRARDAQRGASFTLGQPATSVEGVQWPSWRRTADLDAVLAGERAVRFHAYTPDDIQAALRVAQEFGLDAIVEGAYGAHAVADDLAEAGTPVVLAPAMTGGGGEAEEFARTPETAARLFQAGVPVAFSTNGSGGRSVTMEALVGRGHGLPEGATLRALTLNAARVLGVATRIGSLEPGKDADLVLWSGDPVGTWGEARLVVVGGEVVYRAGRN